MTTAADAVEDEFGVFTNANASITGPVNVLDNVINVYWDSFGVSVRSEVSAADSMATALSDVPVTIVNNTIYADWYGAGIYVSNDATASTLALRFDDAPNALMVTTLDVSGNDIYCQLWSSSLPGFGGNQRTEPLSNRSRNIGDW